LVALVVEPPEVARQQLEPRDKVTLALPGKLVLVRLARAITGVVVVVVVPAQQLTMCP
jgi:hypothetical protein